jgi:hypothetical protein
LAILLMVQGHTFSALLEPGALLPDVERLHALIHGLTAPMFLTGAGLAFGVTSYPRYRTQRIDAALFRARMGRCALLMLVGYALQLPGASPIAAFKLTGPQQALLLRVGPLHLIAVTLCVSQVLMRTLRSPRVHACTCAALGLAVMASTPAVWKSSISPQLGVALGSWLDDHYGSHFSIFPWASFVFLGVGIGGLVSASSERLHALALATLGGLLACGAYALFALDLVGFEPRWFWYTSPFYVAFRLGIVLFVLGALQRSGDCSLPARPSDAKPALTAILTRHSLVAYVAHLLLLYGTPITPNLAHRFAQRLSLLGTCYSFVAVLLLTLSTVYLFELRARARRAAAVGRSRTSMRRPSVELNHEPAVHVILNVAPPSERASCRATPHVTQQGNAEQ